MIVDFAKKEDIELWIDFMSVVKDDFPGIDLEQYKIALKSCVETEEAIVAKENGKVIGALAFIKSDSEIAFLAVRPKYRNKGIGKILVKKMISTFESGTKISVLTYCDGDDKGSFTRKFFESLGFSEGEFLSAFDYPCQEMYYIVSK